MSLDHSILKDARPLVDCAMGRRPADLVIRKGIWVCVQSGEFIPNTDIAVVGERIAYVGPDASHTVGPQTKVIEAHGRYLVPGLLDGHMHVESGNLTVTEFVRAVTPRGTTGMFIDPHEIANVFGLKGVRLMVDEAAQQPVHVFTQVPSCVPSAPGMETPGAAITPEDVETAVQWPGIIGLGEVMNFPGVFNSDEKMHAEMSAARAAGKVIGGHYPTPDLGLAFHGYAAGGPSDDHEGTRKEDAAARVRQGMKSMMRYGSAWHDVAEQSKAVTEMGLDPRNFILCTDDAHAATLAYEGHMDRAVRHAIANGIPAMTAVQMATINTAEHFGVSREMGMIAPGRYADVVLTRDLVNFQAEVVIAQGRVLAEQGQWVVELPPSRVPDWALHSVHLPRKLNAADFRLTSPTGRACVTANVIGVIENQAPTRHLRLEMPVQDGEVRASFEKDVAKLALVERHHGTGRVQLGLVHGLGFDQKCAVATTMAHDSHHMIVVGTDDECMAAAVNALAEWGGGQVVVRNGEVIGKLLLPVGGIMSAEPAGQVAAAAATVLEGYRACGCQLNNPNMQVSLLGLVVIPELRISDLGLVDVTQFGFVPVLE